MSAFISNDANTYVELANDIAVQSELPNSIDIRCPLSLNTPADNCQYFDWIHIKSVNAVKIPYSIEELNSYMNLHNYNRVPDPTRSIRLLDHMTLRVKYIVSLPAFVRSIKSTAVTNEFISRVFDDILMAWLYDYRSMAESYGILINIYMFEKKYLIHYVNTDAATQLLSNEYHGACILRISSYSEQLDNERPFTIFTLSYIPLNSRIIFHIRFCQLHGVGVYNLTRGHNNELPCIPVNKFIQSATFGDVLENISYAQPHYVSIIDMLDQLEKKEYIVLSRLLYR